MRQEAILASADLELCYLAASEALERFKARTLSPVELLDAQIARTQAINPALNAITYDYFDRAREQAKKAEAKYARTDGRPRALEGVPVAIKDGLARSKACRSRSRTSTRSRVRSRPSARRS